MSSTITFNILFNDCDYQIQLARELCNWENFSGSLMDQSTELSETTLYYFDSNNTKQTIMDSASFATMLLDSSHSEGNTIHLYGGSNVHGAATATTSEWVFAPEDGPLDDAKRSEQSDKGTSFSDLYSSCFRQLGHLISKHSRLIESNPYLRVLVSRFSSSIAATPDAEMIARLDQWLTSYNPTATSNNKEHGKRHKHRHGGRRDKDATERCNGRRAIIDSLPDDLAQFLMKNRPGRHHHHHAHPGLFPWNGMHKHKHQHHHHHHHDEQPFSYSIFGFGPSGPFDPTTTGPWGNHSFFGGRHGKFSTMCSRSDRHFEKSMKHQHRHHHRHPFMYDAPTNSPPYSSDSTSSSDSSNSSSSENDDNNNIADRKKVGSKRQQKKLWKAIAKEQFRRAHGQRCHYGMNDSKGFYGYGSHSAPMPFYPGRPLFDGQAPPLPPDYIEQSFGQMHIGESKRQ